MYFASYKYLLRTKISFASLSHLLQVQMFANCKEKMFFGSYNCLL